jgi:hypothetical protein
MVKSTVLAFIVATGLSGSASAALADDQELMMDVMCSRTADLAEVRIGWEDNCDFRGEQCLRAFSRLPQTLDGGLSARAPKPPLRFRAHCALPDGAEIRVRVDEEAKQATGYGEGDPSDFLTVWAGRRKLLSRSMVYAGHNTDNPWVAAVLISGSKVEFCTRSDNERYDPSMPVNCTDEPPQFRDLPVKP